MVCGYNLENESPAARQMKYSLLRYMQQTNFNPVTQIEQQQLEKLFVMREDTNDRKITLKVRTTQARNMMIGNIAFKKQ